MSDLLISHSVDRAAIQRRVLVWIADGARNPASETMAYWLGFRVRRSLGIAHPQSYSDMNDCLQLLRHVPELRAELDIMSELSPEWRAIVKNWSFTKAALTHDLKRFIEREVAAEKISLKERVGEQQTFGEISRDQSLA